MFPDLMLCKHKNRETDCEWCCLSVAWAVVKNSRALKDAGMTRSISWARAVIDLKDQKRVVATRATHDPEGDVNA